MRAPDTAAFSLAAAFGLAGEPGALQIGSAEWSALRLAVAGVAASLAVAGTAAGQGAPGGQGAADTPVAPFSAEYVADWKGISIGTSHIELKADAQPGSYVYTWSITARGIFKLAYHDDLVQTSRLDIDGGHVRPLKYHGKQGSEAVDLNFDWPHKRATGDSQGKPVDIKLKPGTQDVMSIQVEVMRDLKEGNLPKIFQIIDKDELKEFNYSEAGTEKLKTEIGELDTVIVLSQRTGNNRILKMWFAPSLGFVPVQAERSRDGKVEIAMRIKSLTR